MPDMAPVSQLAIAYPFLAALWLVGVLSTSPGYEFLGTVIFLMFGPTFIMGVAVALGLPLRLNRRLSLWWLGNWPMYLLIAGAGAGLLIAGFNTPERQIGTMDGLPFDVTTSHPGFVLTGCFALTFLAVNAGRRATRKTGKGLT